MGSHLYKTLHVATLTENESVKYDNAVAILPTREIRAMPPYSSVANEALHFLASEAAQFMSAAEGTYKSWDMLRGGDNFHILSDPEMHAYDDNHIQLVIGAVVQLPQLTLFVVFQDHQNQLQVVLFAHKWGGHIVYPYNAKGPFLTKMRAINDMVVLYWNNGRVQSRNKVLRPRNSSLERAPWRQKFRQASENKRASMDYAWFGGSHHL